MLKLLLKAIAVAVSLVVAVVVFGVTGISFVLWPTSVSDKTLQITPQVLQQLQALKSERKFVPDAGSFYPGAPNEVARIEAQSVIDSIIETLRAGLPASPRRSTVLKAFKATLPAFDLMDSEEQDQAAVYCERIMAITGVESSGELLNVWRYGFPYGWLKRT